MKNYLFVAIGAALGGSLRYWMSEAVQKIFPATFPFGTLSVNVVGSFILGIIIFFCDSRQLISPEFKLVLAIGFCGGFTTFSTFSYETFNLIRDSEYLLALLNVGLNLFVTLFAVILAYVITKILIGG